MLSFYHWGSLWRVIWPLLWVLSLAACSGQPLSARYEAVQIHQPDVSELENLLSGPSLLRGWVSSQAPSEENIFTLSPQMHQFLDIYITQPANKSAKIRQLIGAIVNPQTLGLRYNPFKTYTAADTFKYREGNCLSFTIMVIAMAREMGIDAHFNEVEVPPIWDMQNENTYVLYKHINVVVKPGAREKTVVDLNMNDYDVSYPQRKIDDHLVWAQYYNNRGGGGGTSLPEQHRRSIPVYLPGHCIGTEGRLPVGQPENGIPSRRFPA